MAMADGAGDGELFKAPEAQLYLVEGGESVLLQSGHFALTLVRSAASQLAAVVAMVGEMQWPVGRDSSAARDGEKSFRFTLPGALTYSVVMGASTGADLQRLEQILEEYSDWQKRAEEQAQPTSSTAKGKGQLLWPPPPPPLLPLPPMRRIDSRKRTIESSSSSGSLSLSLTGRMLRAHRISAVAKLFSKTLERGAITAANDIKPMEIHAAPARQTLLPNLALASVDAVTKVVDAVETGGRTLQESLSSVVAAVAASNQPTLKAEQADLDAPCDLIHDSISSGWTLNQPGLLKLFRIITAIHSSGSSSGCSSRSCSSSSSEFRRLLSSSSSSSSSSFSSKSPTTPLHAQGAATVGDVTSAASSLQPAASPCTPPAPPRPPIFSHHGAPRVQHSHMPPPSGAQLPAPMPANASTAAMLAASQSSTPPQFRIYKPRPMSAAAPATTRAPLPPPSLARPPRFQPPSKS